MKSFLKASLFLTILPLSMMPYACSEAPDTVEKEFLYTVSSDAVMVGTPVVFTDLSLGVATRSWIFEDAEPASSTGAQPTVVFNSRGDKTCVLEIVYRDNTVERREIPVHVSQAISAELKVEGLTPKGCAKKGTTIKFSLENLEGDPDVIEWTFPGGTPATSSDLAPEVVWNDQIDEVQVSVRLARTTDDPIETTLTTDFIAGNYPLFHADDRWMIDSFNFDKYAKKGPWFVWGATAENPTAERHEDDLLAVVPGGANGTANCLRMLMPLADANTFSTFYDLSGRENWSNNGRPTVGSRVELVFWARTDSEPGTLGFMPRVNNQVATWFWDSVRNGDVGGILPSGCWEDYFTDMSLDEACAKEGSEVNLYSYTSPDPSLPPIIVVNKEWTRYAFEFDVTVSGLEDGYVLHNTYPGFTAITFVPNAYLYLDGIALNEIEQ